VRWLRSHTGGLRRWANRPEPKRLDRERMYVWVHVGLILVGVGIAARPYSSGALSDLSTQTNEALALCMVVGSGICVVASMIGTADLRIPYLMGGGGQISVMISLGTWVWQIEQTSDLIGTLSGGLAIAILCACVHYGVIAIKETVRITRQASRVAT
jgi:drug/metabolite transporter (DMT)-like permease